jgi:uncharacterized protein (TIGR02757 family)
MKPNKHVELQQFLDEKVDKYNHPGFIENDPICIPHSYKKKQDIEIAGFLAATLAWGQRITVINKTKQFLAWMENDPHHFLINHTAGDLAPFGKFKHRTFNGADALYFIESLSQFYKNHSSLEEAFIVPHESETVEQGLINFHSLFFSLDHPIRTLKHVATPARKSACKRINMYLRWMVRSSSTGVDFGLWKNISPAQLVCPLDVHVERVARKLKLIKRTQADWQTAIELTNNLKKFDAQDPVKYDFALFGLGVEEGF